MRSHTTVLALAAAISISTFSRADSNASGILSVPLSGFGSDRGQVVVKLFVQGDDVPRGRGTRQVVRSISSRKAVVRFEHLPHGTYALFAFHDENANGTVDHNIVGIPKEALGFSNGFRVTLFSGIPDFDDLKFRFDQRHPREPIVMH